MRILVHDQSGHPFQVQLSRCLAARGHYVRHLYFASFQSPKGAVNRRPNDSPTLEILGLRIAGEFQKYSIPKRLMQERQYFRQLRAACDDFQPDVLLSGNAAPPLQAMLCSHAKARGVRFVSWVQDLYGVGVRRLVSKRSPLLGAIVGGYFSHLEKKVLKRSDAVVSISDDFQVTFDNWGVPRPRVRTIPNWAPLDEIIPLEKRNPWAMEQGLSDVPTLLYAGTLGMKHNPDLLVRAAESVAAYGAQVVVISEGLGADYLKTQQAKRGLSNLRLLDFQPFERMSEVLASADILLTILEPDAGVFAVPSKVLSYLCARRALLLAVPTENLAARMIRTADAGLVLPPDDIEGFARAAADLLRDHDQRQRMAANGRRLAESEFDIDRIAAKFEAVLDRTVTAATGHST